MIPDYVIEYKGQEIARIGCGCGCLIVIFILLAFFGLYTLLGAIL